MSDCRESMWSDLVEMNEGSGKVFSCGEGIVRLVESSVENSGGMVLFHCFHLKLAGML